MTTMKKIRLGLYGCNMYRTRDLLAGAEAAMPGVVEVRGAFDIDPARARFAAEKYGGKVFDSVEAFLASPDFDVVLISLPPYLHAGAFARTTDAGKDVYLEKPICIDQAGRDTVTEAVARRPVKCYVGLSYRHVAPFRKVAEILRRPDSGPILGVHHHWLAPARKTPLAPQEMNWRHRLDQSGGQLIHHCCHVFDWFHALGGPMDAVIASAYTPAGVDLPHEERELTAIFSYRTGGQAVFNLCQHSHHYVQYGVVNAADVTVEYQWGHETFVKVFRTRNRVPDEVYSWSLSDQPGDGGERDRNASQMGEFMRAYLEGGELPLGVRDGLRAYDLAVAIRESGRSGRRVSTTTAGDLTRGANAI